MTFVSEAASRLLALRDGLVVEHGQLRTLHPVDTSRLRRLISNAASCSRRASSGDPWLRMEPSARDGAVAMVIISDPDSVAMPDQDLLRVLFHLTPAESELARRLAMGTSVAEAAGQLDLSRETIRKRLKAIFEKTGTCRQSELVVLLLRTARLFAANR